MSALSDLAHAEGIAAKASWDSIADDIEALGSGGGSLTWPSATNLIGGTEPGTIALPPGDNDGAAELLVKQDMRLNSMPDGSIIFIGDSLIQPMPLNLATPFGVGVGYSGASMRRILTHMKRAPFKAAFQRAGAAVIWGGMNDAGNTTYYGSYLAAVPTVIQMFSTHIKNWRTGPWLILMPLRADNRVSGIPAQYNQAADEIGAGIASAFSSVSGVRVFDPNTALIDGTGNLATANHTGDGQHLSKAGYDILCPLIADELAALGVPGW